MSPDFEGTTKKAIDAPARGESNSSVEGLINRLKEKFRFMHGAITFLGLHQESHREVEAKVDKALK